MAQMFYAQDCNLDLLSGKKIAIVGGGPSALVAAHDLAKAGFKVAIFERKLAPGGGTWGGAMLFNEVVVQSEALPICRNSRRSQTDILPQTRT